MLVGMGGFLDAQVQKGIISGQLYDPLILKRDNMQKKSIHLLLNSSSSCKKRMAEVQE